jgi:acetaldehyde dehydrogenase (acetylating)
MGHTMSIHSKNDAVILECGLKKPAFRIVVNTPTTHGSIGMTTGLDPSMTRGCGGYGGNITSDNISPRHLLNIKRLAYETRPINAASTGRRMDPPAEPAPLPKAPVVVTTNEVDGATMRKEVASYLSGRPGSSGFQEEPSRPGGEGADLSRGSGEAAKAEVATFVCEADVKEAMKAGRKIVIGERTIVTPSARDLAEAHRIFVQATWPRL